ncbi:MAG: hypothetical protein JKY01_02595, partial [Pseudomonadales bacterium]|nr:hypothetical protein [Pseudomonadales bacterium]
VFESEEITYSLQKKNAATAEQYDVPSDEATTHEDENILPKVWFLSSGEITPFSIAMFSESDSDRRYLISANAVGEIILQTPNSAGG